MAVSAKGNRRPCWEDESRAGMMVALGTGRGRTSSGVLGTGFEGGRGGRGAGEGVRRSWLGEGRFAASLGCPVIFVGSCTEGPPPASGG